MESKWPEVKIPAEWEKKDIYKPVFLNKYGYYELRKQNTPEERGKNLKKIIFRIMQARPMQRNIRRTSLRSFRTKSKNGNW